MNTEASKKLFNNLQTLSVIQCIDEEYIRFYYRLQDNAPKHKNRNRLYSEIDNCSIEELIKMRTYNERAYGVCFKKNRVAL